MEKSKWTNRPTTIENWEKDITHVMFVDESGTSDITRVLKLLSKREEIPAEHNYFTVTGCVFTKENYIIAQDKIKELKNRYWENGCFTYANSMRKVCLHSREIRRNEAAFSNQNIDYESFIADLSIMMQSLDYKIISITIKKDDYLLKKYHFNIYNTAMCFLLQRFIYVMPTPCKGLIMLEARGKDEDKIVLEEMSHIINVTRNKRYLFKRTKE